MVLVAGTTQVNLDSTPHIQIDVSDFDDNPLGHVTFLPSTGAEITGIGPTHLKAAGYRHG